MTTPAQGTLPLAGLRVLSFAEQYPGPYATLLLSDLGADVIQVERPAGGDPARRFPALHEALGRGKRSLALDLKDPDAVRACAVLAAGSDLLIEGFRPGVMGRLGLGPAELLQSQPALVYVSISGFGQFGPYRDRPGHDLSYQALAGTLPVPGPAEKDPELPTLTLADLTSGLFAAVAALTGLHAARATGRGAHYDVSMFDSLVSLLTVPLTSRLNDPGGPQPGSDPGYGLFPTSDGRWLALAVAYEDVYWRRICDATDLPHLADLAHPERSARRGQLREELVRAVAARPLSHWQGALHALEVPFGEVNDLDTLLNDPHLQARGLVQIVPAGTGAGAGALRYVPQPVAVDGHRPGPRSPAPTLGQHTVAVLRAAGLSEPDLHELLDRGTALQAPATPNRSTTPQEMSSR